MTVLGPVECQHCSMQRIRILLTQEEARLLLDYLPPDGFGQTAGKGKTLVQKLIARLGKVLKGET